MDEEEEDSKHNPKRFATGKEYSKPGKKFECPNSDADSVDCETPIETADVRSEFLKKELPDREYNSKIVVPVPTQTSPFHLLTPSLYWPHGSTPMGESLNSKQILNNQLDSAMNSSALPKPSPNATVGSRISPVPWSPPILSDRLNLASK